ncbi:transposase [Streptomyces luteoverticillatus]|uniref:Transposase n=1 Tax=Streptomyces luteoverticillatus TaxID=66425 RepID=A0A3Q9FVS6_STRLT|nr:transposase [Streptomyces luteoverticillatus]
MSTEWSSGPVEGRVNDLKALKRSMFGRAKLPLLRKRLLLTAVSRLPQTVTDPQRSCSTSRASGKPARFRRARASTSPESYIDGTNADQAA